MKKVILWIAGLELGDMNENISGLFHSMGGFEIIGISSWPEQMEMCEALNLPMIPVQEICQTDADYILLCGAREKYSRSISYLKEQGVPEDRMIPEHAADIYGFTPERYQTIRHIKPSIISMNCFAGYVYHRLAMPFYSPTINMHQSEESFLQFAAHLKECCAMPIRSTETGYDKNLKRDYPIYHFGNEIVIHMNHYRDAETAEQKWKERVSRINWDHIVLVMYTGRPDVLEAFEELQVPDVNHVKKVCFVSFPSERESAYYIPLEKLSKQMELWDAVNHIGFGGIQLFDMFEMLGVQ